MKPIYKRIKQLVAHCPDCGEELGGNNSIAFPWTCTCGIWKIRFLSKGKWDYEIIN